MSKETIITCDMKDCGSIENVKEANMQVIFHTEQTEGRGCEPHFSNEMFDICSECYKKALNGKYIHGSGAQGHNNYWF